MSYGQHPCYRIQGRNHHAFNKYGGNIQGAIGVPFKLLRRASETNVCKINVGTDFRIAYVGALRKSLAENPTRFEPRVFLEPARLAAQRLVEYKLSHVFMSANCASVVL